MNDFCPDCGDPFDEPRDLTVHWIRLLKCPNDGLGYFLEVGDSKWIYPLQRLQFEAAQQLLQADDELIREAVGRIQRVDYKTVSIVQFESTLTDQKPPKS